MIERITFDTDHILPSLNKCLKRHRFRKPLWTLLFLLITLGRGLAQANSAGSPADSQSQNSVPRSDAEDFPSDGDAPDSIPLLDLMQDSTSQDAGISADSGSAEASTKYPPAPSQSFFLFGLHGGESAENNPSGLLGYSSQISSVTSLFGSVRLRKYMHHYRTAIDYLGGGSLYDNYGNVKLYDEQSQQLSANESVLWQRARLSFRDIFTYLGAGSWGSSPFGGASAYNLRFNDVAEGTPANAGPSDLPVGPGQFVQIGQQSYAFNDSGMELTEVLTPRSSVHMAGDYALTDYLGNSQGLFNSREVSALAGYNYRLTRIDKIGLLYGYQAYQFPGSDFGNLSVNSVQFTYQRTVSGRSDFVLGAGPQFIRVTGGIINQIQQTGVTAQALLRYRWEKSSATASYSRQVTAGSGFFGGATTDTAFLSIDRKLSRSWQATTDGGYTRAVGIGLGALEVFGSSYEYAFAGAAVQRRLGRSLSTFASYQYDGENFAGCAASSGCNSVIRRHIFSAGLDWYIRPVRLE